MPISVGATQKVLERVTAVLTSFYVVIGRQVRQAPVNYINETLWYYDHALHWRWVMASEQGHAP